MLDHEPVWVASELHVTRNPHAAHAALWDSFSVAAGSSVLTEVSGPQLSPTQEFVYDGTTYTVMSVNPGAGQFTAFADNHLFTNDGATITDAAGAMVCGSGQN